MSGPKASNPVLYGYGHIGTATKVREYEDRHFAGIIRNRSGLDIGLAIVADGVGGSNLGQRAAQLTVDTIVESCVESELLDIPQLLGQAIGIANRKVYAESQTYRDRSQMSATAAVAAIVNGRLYVANVGDSRVYLVRGKHVIQLTLDHTWAYERVREGKLKPEDAERHPNAHMITRSVGYQPNVQVDLGLYFQGGKEGGRQAFQQQGFLLDQNDMILVCSDGLIKPNRHDDGYFVHHSEVRDIIGRSSPEKAAKALVDLAVSRNADDNVTAVIVEMPGRSRPSVSLPRFQIGIAAIAIISITVCILAVVGILVVPALLPDFQAVPTPQPGYAYIFQGQVEHQQTGGGFERRGEGDQIQFGAGSILRQGNAEAVLSLPGGYLMRVAGTNDRPTTIEFFQAAGISGKTETVLNLRDGSLFIYSSDDLEPGQGVVVQTAAGRAVVTGTTMGSRFDNNTWLFEVDCVVGNCLLTTNLPVELPLIGGQRSFVDAAGLPNGPFAVNLDLYKANYDLEAFIDGNVIADITATYQPPEEDTPTPNPTPTATITPIPTLTPTSTLTPTPTSPRSVSGSPTATKRAPMTETSAPTNIFEATDTPAPTDTSAPTGTTAPLDTLSPTDTTVPVDTTVPTDVPTKTPKPTNTKWQITLDITLPVPIGTLLPNQVLENSSENSGRIQNPPAAIINNVLIYGLAAFVVLGFVWWYRKKSNL
ncbi:PP2C family protein-serine/threonine phosphatase [Chloroflexota bacterium]